MGATMHVEIRPFFLVDSHVEYCCALDGSLERQMLQVRGALYGSLERQMLQVQHMYALFGQLCTWRFVLSVARSATRVCIVVSVAVGSSDIPRVVRSTPSYFFVALFKLRHYSSFSGYRTSLQSC